MNYRHAKLTTFFSVCLFCLFMTACGGAPSGGTTGGNGGTTGETVGDGDVLTINLVLVDKATGEVVTGVSSTNPGELRASLTLNGAPLASQLVTFDASLGVFDPEIGTALTDSGGLAIMTLEENGVDGAGTVTASASYEGATVSEKLNYRVVAGRGGVTPAVIEFGAGEPYETGFTSGEIEFGIADVSAGGTTSVSVVIYEDGKLYTTPVDISFNSSCAGVGDAKIDEVITSVNGAASATYLAQGCVGNDVVTANVVIGGTNYSATGTVNVIAADVGSLEYVSAEPESINLQETGGAGRSETSVVTFRVVDTQGRSVQNKEVSFELNTTVGGMSLSPLSATSDRDGLVQTTVRAGTVATVVRVTAAVQFEDKLLESQSDQLVATTGIPDQNSTDVSTPILNVEAWDLSGTVATITARLADRYNNPVPDGTAITFATEGGSIESFCTTTDGACSVEWVSQAPRPCGQQYGQPTVRLDETAGPNVCVLAGGTNTERSAPLLPDDPINLFAPMGQPFAGRATIIATAVGEESFNDINGNGIFDEGDFFTDLPEAWLDVNENGVRDEGEPFSDFNSNGEYDGADGMFNGVLCDRPDSNDCSPTQSLNVRDSLVLVMSGSHAKLDINTASGEVFVPFDGTATVRVYVSDENGQSMPSGTAVSVEEFIFDNFSVDEAGLDGEVILSNNDNFAYPFSVTVRSLGIGSGGAESEFEVRVRTASDIITRQLFKIVEGVRPQTDLVLSMAASSTTVAQGNNINLSLSLGNNGNVEEEDADVRLSLDSAFDFIAVNSTDGQCSISSSTLTCAMGSVAIGANETIDVTIQAADTPVLTENLFTDITATATNSSSSDEADSSNNSDSVFITVTP